MHNVVRSGRIGPESLYINHAFSVPLTLPASNCDRSRVELSEDLRAALDEKVYVHLATVMTDGSPHVSVVWVGRDGDKILFSTAEGRVKTANIRRDNRVGLSFTPGGDEYKNYVMRGTVTRSNFNGIWLIDNLATKYTGSEKYEWAPPGQVRVNGEIEIDSIAVNK